MVWMGLPNRLQPNLLYMFVFGPATGETVMLQFRRKPAVAGSGG